jgi:hypothetical protein
MRHFTRLPFVALALAALMSFAIEAGASIIGVVTTPLYFCLHSGSSYFCPYPSMQPTYAAMSVSGTFVDFNQTSGTLSAKACDQSWSGATLHCNTPTTSSITGFNDMFINGFSLIPSATGSIFDYYYVQITSTTGGYTLLGCGYE